MPAKLVKAEVDRGTAALTYRVEHTEQSPGGTTVWVNVDVFWQPGQPCIARISETGPEGRDVAEAIRELGRWLRRVGAEMESLEVADAFPFSLRAPKAETATEPGDDGDAT